MEKVRVIFSCLMGLFVFALWLWSPAVAAGVLSANLAYIATQVQDLYTRKQTRIIVKPE
jgi:hypothetical protein